MKPLLCERYCRIEMGTRDTARIDAEHDAKTPSPRNVQYESDAQVCFYRLTRI